MNAGEVESYGKLGAFAFAVVSTISAFAWKTRRQGEQIQKLESVVFPPPDRPRQNLLTVEWHDRIQAECELRRAKDMEILSAHIVAQLRDKLDELKDEVWERRRDIRQ